jgi:cytochrome c oxidase assembly protein subunit 15
MPFDEREFPASADELAAARDRRLVAAWLFAVAFMVLVMVVLGGVTRLTGSGLSIMEWAPLKGALPPLGHAEWERLFGLYKQIPQYALVNDGLTLEGFRRIFWLEWAHRLWGRLIGLAFLVPLIWLWATGRIERRLRPRLALLFVLGGMQGAVGWFMVASGFLPDTTSVSPYRLVAHLTVALILYAALLWTGLSLWRPVWAARMPTGDARGWIAAVCVLVPLTMIAGGFVAGTHAGLIYNTFPLMDGRLVPADWGALHPALANLTENVAAVQFDHRLLATVTAIVAALAVVAGLRAGPARVPRPPLVALGALVALQYALGVATLLAVVPVGLAAAHQATALLVLTAALTTYHGTRPATVARTRKELA